MKRWRGWYSRAAAGDHTIDEEKRTASAVISTEQAVIVFDWERWEPVQEILLSRGMMPIGNQQVPLLNAHSRYSTTAVRGSARNIVVADGEMRADVVLSSLAEDEWTLIREGHLTDLSVGYRTYKDHSVRIDPGKTADVNGKKYSNDDENMPLYVRTQWQLKEVSLVPIGADDMAKFRAEVMPSRANIDSDTQKTKGVRMDQEETKKREEEQRKAHDIEMEEAKESARKEAERKAEENAEQKRVATQEIREMVRSVPVEIMPETEKEEIISRAIDASVTIDEVRKMIVDNVKKVGNTAGVPDVRASADEADKYHRGVVESILCRSGAATPEQERDNAQADVPRGLHAMIRQALVREGVSAVKVANMTGDDLAQESARMWRGWHGRADSVSAGHLPYILADASNKVLMKGYEDGPATWRQWCATGSAPDFKTVNMPTLSITSDWAAVIDGEPIPKGKIGDKYETGSVTTHGRGISVSRKAIVNDDLDALTDLLRWLGMGAARRLEDQVYYNLVGTSMAGPTVTESGKTNLFDNTSGKDNLLGSSGAVSTTTLGTARKTLRKLPTLAPDDAGETRSRYTGIDGRYLVTGVDNEEAIMRFFNSAVLGGYGTSAATMLATSNIWTGTVVPIFSPALQYYLTDQSVANGWYLIADPRSGYQLCKVIFLNGKQVPYLRKAESGIGDPLGVNFEGYFDFGVAFPEWRAGVANDGA